MDENVGGATEEGTRDSSSDDTAGRLPRVLFVSVNPFSQTSNNGKTFASFFEGYGTDALAQLYFHRELPSSPVCDNYFRITDEDLVHDLVRPWRVTGERVTARSSSTTPIPRRTHSPLRGSPGMSVDHPGLGSWGRRRVIGPQESITRASAAWAEWNP